MVTAPVTAVVTPVVAPPTGAAGGDGTGAAAPEPDPESGESPSALLLTSLTFCELTAAETDNNTAKLENFMF